MVRWLVDASSLAPDSTPRQSRRSLLNKQFEALKQDVLIQLRREPQAKVTDLPGSFELILTATGPSWERLLADWGALKTRQDLRVLPNREFEVYRREVCQIRGYYLSQSASQSALPMPA